MFPIRETTSATTRLRTLETAPALRRIQRTHGCQRNGTNERSQWGNRICLLQLLVRPSATAREARSREPSPETTLSRRPPSSTSTEPTTRRDTSTRPSGSPWTTRFQKGGTFYLLNTQMTVISRNYSYHLPSQNRNVNTIFAQGISNYLRNDTYGQFTATYTWNAYFDPSTGYIVGYQLR